MASWGMIQLARSSQVLGVTPANKRLAVGRNHNEHKQGLTVTMRDTKPDVSSNVLLYKHINFEDMHTLSI